MGRKLKASSRYFYEKHIEELVRENAKLADKLFNYRTTVLEIYDGIIVGENRGDDVTSNGWLLGRIRRCLK